MLDKLLDHFYYVRQKFGVSLWIFLIAVMIGRTMIPVPQTENPPVTAGWLWLWWAQVAVFALLTIIIQVHRDTNDPPPPEAQGAVVRAGQSILERGSSAATGGLSRVGSRLSRASSFGSIHSYETDELMDLGTGPDEPRIPTKRLHVGVMERWAKKPQAPMLWMEGEDKPRTAGAMRGYANFVAAKLLEGDVGKIVPVMAIMDDGPEFVAGIMGVMIAGAAFCPMDVTHPPDRVRYMLDSMAASVIVSSKRASDTVTGRFEWKGRLVEIDCSTKPQTVAFPCQPPEKGIDSSIYVIFTSGSTGKPKGTLLSHRALLSHIPYYTERFGLHKSFENHRILRTTAVTFDMCYSQILGALYSGATLVWPKKQLMKDPLEMRRVCETYGVSFLMMVPSALNLFLELSHFPSCVRHVGSGGEALHFEVARAFFADRYVDRSVTSMLHNRYGPTEAAINASIKVMSSAPKPYGGARTVPIGRPSAHRQMFVCDPPEEDDTSGVLQLTEHGVQGEMYIAGACLADGYLNNPEQTQKAFRTCESIEDISGNCLEAYPNGELRVYKTGDLMKWIGDELEFLGRVDSQVKLRGFRIELGEIESQLRACTGMQEAQVIVMDFAQGVQRIVAFISPCEMATSPGIHDVVRKLRKDLPEYMVPERFVGMMRDEWPRTTTGKIDRKELAKRSVPDSCAPPKAQGGEKGAEDGGPVKEGPPQGVDSLGFVRNMHRKERNIDIALDNLRAGIIILVVANHWTGVSWPNLQGWQDHLQRMVTANHTYALCLLSGIDDSRNVNPFRFTAREPVFLLLYFTGLVYFVATFPFWYFPVFVWVKAYTVMCHKLGIPAWIYTLLFTGGYILLPAAGLQVTTWKDRTIPMEAGCFFFDTICPWWQRFVTWALGMYSFDQPFICFSVAPFYWMGLFLGPSILHQTQTGVNAMKKCLPSAVTWGGYFATVVIRIIGAGVCIVLYNALLMILTKPKQACTEYIGDDGHYWANTMWGIEQGISYLVISFASYVPLFAVFLIIAWRDHWKTAGRCVVGAYFLHVFMPYIWWLKQPFAWNCYGNIWAWLKTIAPDNWVGQTIFALLQTVFVFLFPILFLSVLGPFFMVGFVPLMRQLSEYASGFSRLGLTAATLTFLVGHALLSPSLTSLGFYDWLHNLLFGNMDPFLAGTLLTLVFMLLPVCAAFFAGIVATQATAGFGRRRPGGGSDSEESSGDSDSDPEAQSGLLGPAE